MTFSLIIDEALVMVVLNESPEWRTLGNNWRARSEAIAPRGKEHGGSLAANMVVRFNGGAVPNIEVGSELTRDHGVSALDLIESGTRRHPIVGHGKMLRFKDGSGTIVFRKRVDHPGTTANKFVERAAQQAVVMSGGAAFGI